MTIEFDSVHKITLNPDDSWYNDAIFKTYNNVYDFKNPFGNDIKIFGKNSTFSAIPIGVYVGINPKITFEMDSTLSKEFNQNW